MISGAASKYTAVEQGAVSGTVSRVHVCAALQFGPHVCDGNVASLPELIVAQLAAASCHGFCWPLCGDGDGVLAAALECNESWVWRNGGRW